MCEHRLVGDRPPPGMVDLSPASLSRRATSGVPRSSPLRSGTGEALSREQRPPGCPNLATGSQLELATVESATRTTEKNAELAQTGEAWTALFESYLTDPEEHPNPEDWRTEIAYLTTPS